MLFVASTPLNPGSRGSGRVRGFFTQTGFKPL
jgi:hypothetical protein